MATTVGTLLVNVIGDASNLAATLNGAERTIEKFGSRLFFMGSRITAGVTVPVAGFMAAVNKIGSEFDSAMTESLAIMDNVTDEMRQKMEKRAQDISRTGKFSAKEVAEGYYDLASAGFTAEQALDNIGTVTTFAQAGLMKASEAGEFLAGAVSSVGLEMVGAANKTEGMAKVADVLTKANNMALGTVKDFSQALTKQFGGAMKTYNISLETGMALLMGYAENNIKGARASTLASMAVRDVQVSTIRATAAWKEYGISVFDAQGQLRKMPDVLDQILMRMKGFSSEQVKLFTMGKLDPKTAIPENKPQSPMQTTQMFKDLGLPFRSISALQQLLKSAGQIRVFEEGLQNSAGEAAKVAGKQAESMHTKWLAALHGIEAAAIRLYNGFKPILVDLFGLIEQGADKLIALADQFNTLSDSTKRWTLGLVTGVALLGPVIAGVGSWALMMAGVALSISRSLGGFAAIGNAIRGIIPYFTSMTGMGVGYLTVMQKLAPVTAGVSNLIQLMGRFILPLVVGYEMLSPAIQRVIDDMRDLNKESDPKKAQEQLTTWQRVKAVFGDVSEMISLVMSVIQKGWVDIVKLGEAVLAWDRNLIAAAAHTWENFKAAWVDIGAAFVNLAKQADDYIRQIPVIGELYQAAFSLGTIVANEFYNFWTTAFSKLTDAAKGFFATVADSSLWLLGKLGDFLPKEMVGFGKLIADMNANVRDNGLGEDSFHRNVELMRAYAEAIGAVEKNAARGASSLRGLALAGVNVVPVHGGLQPERTGMMGGKNFGNVLPINRNAPDDTNILAGLFPDVPDPTKAAKRDPVGEAYKRLMGDGAKEWQNTFKAFKSHEKEILADEGAMLRLRDAYMAVREEIDHVPQFEKLFETTIAEANMKNLSEAMGEFNMDFHEMTTGGMSFNEFVKKHADEIERLSTRFTEQRPEIQHLIREYQRAASELSTFELRTQSMIRTSKDFNDAVNQQASMSAKLKDKEEELNQFRMSEGDRTLKGLSKNYEQMRLAFLQQVVQMVTDWQNAEPEFKASFERVVTQFMHDGEAMLEVTKRSDLERVASNLVANDLIKRSFQNMSISQLESIVDLTFATRGWLLVIGELQTGMEALAGVFDKAGDGWLSWAAELVSLFGQAKKLATDLTVAGMAIKAAWKSTKIGGTEGQPNTGFDNDFGIMLQKQSKDWKAFGAAMVDVFNILAQGIQLLDKATDSSSRTKNVIGGVAVGSELGKGIGAMFGPVGAMIGQIGGALVGAMIGFFRNKGLRNIVKMTAKEWGTDISDELGKAIEKTMKEVGGNRQVASALHFEDILNEAGGLTEGNFDTFKARLHDFFSFAATGLMPAKKAMEEYTKNFGLLADYVNERGGDLAEAFQEHIDTMKGLLDAGIIDAESVRDFFGKNFDLFAKNLEDSGHLAGAAWQHVIDLMRDAGDMPPNVMEWFKNQTGLAGNQFAGAIKGTTDPFKDLNEKFLKSKGGIADAAKEMKDAWAAVDEATKAHGEAADKDDTTDTWDKLQEAIADASRAQDKYNRLVSEHGELERERQQWLVGTREKMNDLGLLVLKTFNAASLDGLDWVDIMEQLSPALSELAKGYTNLNTQAENPAVQRLMDMFKMYDAHKPLFQGVSSLTQGAITLSRLGGFDDEAAAAVMRQQGRNFTDVQSVVAEAGGTHADALRPFIPFLAEMRRAHKEDGVILDDQTQLMIDQATELGLLRPEVATLQEISTTGFTGVITSVNAAGALLNGSLAAINMTLMGLPSLINTTGPGTGYTGPGSGGTGPGNGDSSGDNSSGTGPVRAGGGTGTREVQPIEFETAESPSVTYAEINITAQQIDEEFVSRRLIPMIEAAGTRNTRGARTRLRNGSGV